MIAVLGINHKTAHVDVRENFSLSSDDIKAFSDLVLQRTEITELVVLSTCNRTEVYFYIPKSCCNKSVKDLVTVFHEYKNISGDFSSAFYIHKEQEAVKHLFRVTSGADSLVVGEDQIVRQVKEAYLLCTKLALTDAVLMRLFQKAFETGKKVRTETGIQRGATSVSFLAVNLCNQQVENLKDKKVMLIGAGETTKTSLQHFKKKGVTDFLFANRTLARAEKLADENDGLAVPFEDFKQYLPKCDVVVSATNSGRLLITQSDVADYMTLKNHKSQTFVDLSIPRNIDDKISELNGNKVICVDDLQTVVEDNRESRLESISNAEAIIDAMTEEYFEWLDIRVLRPIIKTVTYNIKKINEKELESSKGCYSTEDFQKIDEYSGRLTQKFIRTFIKSLKDIQIHDKDTKTLKKIQQLFEFDEAQ